MPVRHKLVVPLTEAQQELAVAHIEVAHNMARRHPTTFDDDDALGIALLALCVAAADWEHNKDKCKTFAGFAAKRIKFEFLDEARLNSLVHISGDWSNFRAERDKRTAWTQRIPSNILGKTIDASIAVDRADWHREFWKVVNSMRHSDQCLIRRRLAGASGKEMAAELGITHTCLRQRLTRLFAFLGRKMKRFGTF